MTRFFLVLTFFFALTATAQTPMREFSPFYKAAEGTNPALLRNGWKSRWIGHPTTDPTAFGVYHFRKTLTFDTKPGTFVVHVSADNRYRLYVNGQEVAKGPARGDKAHWRYETIDLAPHLVAGRNVIAAEVWNFAKDAPLAQISHHTGFIMQGNGEAEQVINSNDSWLVTQNQAYTPIPFGPIAFRGYYVVGPGEMVDAGKYPWGWQNADFDDSPWQKARIFGPGAPYGLSMDSQWGLVPRPIPAMEEYPVRIPKIARTTLGNLDTGFLAGTKDLTIPARTKGTLLLDQTYLTNAYPHLLVSKGKGAEVKLTYQEALYDKDWKKGHRDEIEGKEITGHYDIFRPDGGARRQFRPLWFRTYRYLQLDIETQDEPLVIHDLYGMFTGYPFEEKGSFQSNDPVLSQIWNVGWRTARLCAIETYVDCPYWEQLQYIGDTRIQALISLYVSGDDRLVRQSLMHFDESRIPEGLTASRYPHALQQLIPPYSLFHIAMIHDYSMYRDDLPFVRSLYPGVQSILSWYERYVDKNGMLANLPWWNFVDHRSFHGKEKQPIGKDEQSANITLQYAYALNYAAELAKALGYPHDAQKYLEQSAKLKKATYALCWDAGRGLLADTPEKKFFSQHANLFAILTNTVPQAQQAALMKKLLADQSLTKTTIYFDFYTNRALEKVGMADTYLDHLQPWKNMLGMGLTTFAEMEDPTRSDCHAWSASPNYDLLATVCGIKPGSAGFGSVRIEPALGTLQQASGKVPHPAGTIEVSYTREANGKLKAEITLPPTLTGAFVWKGQSVPLKAGKQVLSR
ncbi:hypothetical protein GCM10027275_18800 [Rhabdobacter roseus]|uniref:Alpha-L-rhamnosidase n=1 Tax=Rhabdobacter roseus TaxID=1655419 RepID=A0A840TLJ4_9BACT|nr:alpha-L-rhamnosidase C-terminal domain-containing protein [Rhabdobacter roseus]MBB5283805.1 hypothetical protein [Rhabdobacter roseus]